MCLRTGLTAFTGEELPQINQSAHEDELPSVMTLSSVAATVTRSHTFGFKSFAIFSYKQRRPVFGVLRIWNRRVELRLPPQVGAGDDLGQNAQPPPHRPSLLPRVNRRPALVFGPAAPALAFRWVSGLLSRIISLLRLPASIARRTRTLPSSVTGSQAVSNPLKGGSCANHLIGSEAARPGGGCHRRVQEFGLGEGRGREPVS